jgi:MFS family permease
MESNSRILKKNWILIWLLGMAGQICWNIENSWFNTFVYAKIAPNPTIISWMVAVSAAITTFATFLIGTLSDRRGRRKPFIVIGYICWGMFTIAFGASEFLPKNPIIIASIFVITTDAVMSFFGSVGNDSGFSTWTTDISNEHNRGKLGGALAAMPVLATIFGSVVSGIIIDQLDYFPFFIIMGGFVMAVGFITIFTLKDSPDLKPKRDEKGYWHQFLSVFNISTFKKNKELFWVFIVMLTYFIGFNVYFPYITIYFVNYLNLNYTMTGIIQGAGLLAAVLLTIPAARFIDKGKSPFVILFAVVVNFMGLFTITLSSAIPMLLIGVLGAGMGYVLTFQTLIAWIKNLYPEDQRGQFEGIKQIFFVCLPMIIGPSIATVIINKLGVRGVIDGVAGMIPTESLFIFSAVLTSLTVLPLIPAYRLNKARLHSSEKDDTSKVTGSQE